MQATIIRGKSSNKQRLSFSKSSASYKVVVDNVSTQARGGTETCDLRQSQPKDVSLPVYTRDEFFAALKAASKGQPPLDDPRWQAIPREDQVHPRVIKDAKKAIQESLGED